MTTLAVLVQVVSTICTAAIAAVAIVANRKSTRDMISKDLQLTARDSRASTYVDLIRAVDQQNISEGPSVEGLIQHTYDECPVDLLPTAMDSPEWKTFEAHVEVYATIEVRHLYLAWKAALSWWTWSTIGYLTKLDKDGNDNTDLERFREQQKHAENDVRRARDELLWLIRSELEFREHKMPRFRVYPDGAVSSIMRVQFFDSPRSEDLPSGIQIPYIKDVVRVENGWSFTWVLGHGGSEWKSRQLRGTRA